MAQLFRWIKKEIRINNFSGVSVIVRTEIYNGSQYLFAMQIVFKGLLSIFGIFEKKNLILSVSRDMSCDKMAYNYDEFTQYELKIWKSW